MKSINENWLKDDIKNKCKIEELKGIKNIIECSGVYKSVFNGPPFYEDWNLESSMEVINSYIKDKAIVLSFKYEKEIVGFLVVINKVPIEQQIYVEYLNQIKYIEEIGVLNSYRNKRIASELVRILLLNYLNKEDKYICYRTNAMRYFELSDKESFESSVIRIQKEDKIKRLNNEKIVIPEFNNSEKQKFINMYIELIKNRPDLDVSNSSALFRNIFGIIDYSKKDGNYTFQKDPTGEGNDRVFPFIDLEKTLYLRR